MKINRGIYNIPVVETGATLVAGESVIIGNQKDLDKLVRVTNKSGLMRVKTAATIGGNTLNFDGTCVCNFFVGNIEFHTIVYASDTITGGDPIVIGGQLYMDGANLKCHITAVTLASNRTKK